MLTSTIVLVTGFLIVSTSGFHITSGMGMLAAMVIAAALLADWFLLPPVLLAIDGKLFSLKPKDTGKRYFEMQPQAE